MHRYCIVRALLGAVLYVIASPWVAAGQQLPAVSGANAKFEFDAGVLSLPAPAFVGRAAGTLTLPLGERFGLQVDVAGATRPGVSASAALHLFTRDPARYLIGGTLGMVRTPGAVVFAAGPEAELYFDRWTVEAWAGASVTHALPAAPDRYGAFIIGDLAYYPTDNWRVDVGLSHLDGYGAVHVGTEYQFGDGGPLSLTADARLGQDGAVRAMVGLRTYLGGSDKSLIRRHREDDPTDRGLSLAAAVGGRTITGAPPSSEPSREHEASEETASSEASASPDSSSEPPPGRRFVKRVRAAARHIVCLRAAGRNAVGASGGRRPRVFLEPTCRSCGCAGIVRRAWFVVGASRSTGFV